MNGENVTKVYVDSPIFTREDEERFRYVNPNVDDEDDEIRFVPRDSLVGLKREREHDEHRPRDASNAAGRYESVDHVYNHGFVAPSKPPAVDERKRTRQAPVDYNSRRSDPMTRELNEEVEEERIEMEQRNQSQLRKARQNNIPQLDLVDSEDEERARGRRFTDLEIDDGRCFDSAETAAEQLWAAKQRNVLVAKEQRKGSTEGKMEARQRVLQQSHFTSVKPAPISSQHRTLPPIAPPQQYYNPDDQVLQQQILFQPVGIPSDEQMVPRGFLPFQPYTIDGAGDTGLNVMKPLRQTESGRPANQNRVALYQRRVGSESNIMRKMPYNDQTNSAKDHIMANKREVIRKEKPKKSYGELFSDRRKKENVDAGPMQRWRSEEVRVRQPMSENHSFRNVPGDFVGQPPAAVGHHQVAMTQPPVGTAQHSAYPSYVPPAQPVLINVDPVSLPYGTQPVSLTYHQPPVALTQQQPSHQFHGGYPFQQMPMAPAAPVEQQQQQQQRISIPLQFQGNSTATDQQKVSVDINLRLLNMESEIQQPQPPFSPSKLNHQQLQTNGNALPSYSRQSQATSNDTGISVVNGQSTNRTYATTSPYKVLPPVGSADLKKATLGGRPLRNSGGNAVKNGYAEQLMKQKQTPQYKEYTLNDYRRMKKEVKTLNLGKLGPDLENEERVEKQLKEKRKQMYSKQVNQRNRTGLAARSRRDSASEDSVHDEESVTRRKLALEYAKTIPKPKTFTRGGGKESLASKESSLKADSDTELFLDEYEELRLLKERHEMERKQLELIERGVKTILAQNA